MIDKREVVAAAIAALEAQLATARAQAEATRRDATHEEARAENDKDTRGLEQSYLARGQAMRAEELDEALTRLRFLDLRAFGEDDPIGAGALVTLLDDEDAEAVYLVAPVAGGTKVEVGGVEVRLVTPAAPLGRALVEKRVGDDFALRLGGRAREYEILAVA